MGGEDKRFAEVGGEPIALGVLRKLRSACARVLVAVSDEADGARFPGAAIVRDAAPDAGPLAGLVAALEASDGDVHLVVAGDLPFLDPRVLLRLAGLLGDADAAVPRTGRGLEPLHAAWRRRALPAARAALDRGALKLEALARSLPARIVEPAEWRDLDPEELSFRNVNTPAELAAARRRVDRATRGH
jgi:molybdopterin-guanine dinucleotide biosynthesis protein A